MRRIISFSVALTVIITLGSTALAERNNPVDQKASVEQKGPAQQVKESYSMSIIIDGKEKNLRPIISDNGYTLLPLNQSLASLGVPNDDRHIIWDAGSSTITIIKDQLNIVLKIGSKTAVVNGKSMDMPVTPVIYKDTVYIPARFVSQLLDKKIIWDGKTRTVVIRDSEQYRNSKEILDKSAEAMKDIRKLSVNFSYYAQVLGFDSMSGKELGFEVSLMVDQPQERLYYKRLSRVDNEISNYEYYVINDIIYSLASGDEHWSQWKIDADFHELMTQSNPFVFTQNYDEKAYAGLGADGMLSTDKEIVLSGKWFIQDIDPTMPEGSGSTRYKPFDVKFYIDRDTYYMKKAEIKYSYTYKNDNVSTTVNCYAFISYSDYNGDFQITLPRSVYIDKGQNILIAGSTAMQPISLKLSKPFMKSHPNVLINVSGGGSDIGILATANKTCHIGAVSRLLTREELGEMNLKQYVLGYDGIAVVINPDNKVYGLSAGQLKKIFSGDIVNWKDIGGTDAPINIYIREDSSGESSAFSGYLAGNGPKDERKSSYNFSKSSTVLSSTESVLKAVASDAYSIGIVSYGYINNTVKPLNVDGVQVSEENIRKGTYPVTRVFAYVTRGEPVGWVKEYIDYILSEDGQKIIRENRFTTFSY